MVASRCTRKTLSFAVQFLFVFSLVNYSAVSLGDYVYPAWANVVGWLMFAVTVALIPFTALVQAVKVRRENPTLASKVYDISATVQRKGKEMKSIYIAPFCTEVHTKRSGTDHTVLPANNTMPAFPSCAFTRCHHHSN